MKKLAVALGILMFFFAIGCSDTSAGKEAGKKAFDFELRDMEGKTFRLSDYRGKIIILNFFATWCPPCRIEMPDFDEIEKERADVKVIAVNVGRESAERVKQFASSNNLEFTMALDDGQASRLYGPIRGIPVTVIIDKEFNIAKKYVGMRPKEVFVRDIESLE